jgi:hypothetical protein
MKRLFLSSITCILFSITGYSQSKAGAIAGVYINTPDLDSSLALYEKPGFSKTASNDFPAPWAQVIDGSLHIMMRKDITLFIGLI